MHGLAGTTTLKYTAGDPETARAYAEAHPKHLNYSVQNARDWASSTAMKKKLKKKKNISFFTHLIFRGILYFKIGDAGIYKLGLHEKFNHFCPEIVL